MHCTSTRDSTTGCWHAIYQTGNLDYCREDLDPAIASMSDAKAAAVALFGRVSDSTARRAVDSYRLERW